MSTKSKPIELKNAILAAESAWDAYDASIERGDDKETRQQYWDVVNLLEERKSALYAEWQRNGGTSNIETLHPVEFAYRVECEMDGTRQPYDDMAAELLRPF